MRVDTIGTEKHNIIVADDVVPNPDRLLGLAANANFDITSPLYPGMRALGPVDYVMELAPILGETIRSAFGWDPNMVRPVGCHFSIVTTPADQLNLAQRIPHFDGPDERLVALLHYLCDETCGGTAFFRHRASGFESITKERKAPYEAQLRTAMEDGDMPAQDYHRGSTPLYEQIASYDAKFNRLIAYRGMVLHSGYIPEDLPLIADPSKGRLTLNTFLYYYGD